MLVRSMSYMFVVGDFLLSAFIIIVIVIISRASSTMSSEKNRRKNDDNDDRLLFRKCWTWSKYFCFADQNHRVYTRQSATKVDKQQANTGVRPWFSLSPFLSSSSSSSMGMHACLHMYYPLMGRRRSLTESNRWHSWSTSFEGEIYTSVRTFPSGSSEAMTNIIVIRRCIFGNLVIFIIIAAARKIIDDCSCRRTEKMPQQEVRFLLLTDLLSRTRIETRLTMWKIRLRFERYSSCFPSQLDVWNEKRKLYRWCRINISSDSQDDQHENNQGCFSETMSCSFITADSYCCSETAENERTK